MGVLVGLGLAAGCRQLNASHCGNQAGDATCMQRNAMVPYCDRCSAVDDGCVAEPVSEAGCGETEASSGPPTTAVATIAPTDAGSADAASATIGSTDAADSSTGEPNLCGNGVIDGEEACDGELPEGTPDCAAMDYGAGTPTCADDCTISYMMCPTYEEECGNGEVGEAEECDGTNLANQTCDDFQGMTGDGLVCTEACLFNTTDCMSCVESDDPCEPTGEPCCNAPAEACIGLLGNKRCCVGNGLGGCA